MVYELSRWYPVTYEDRQTVHHPAQQHPTVALEVKVTSLKASRAGQDWTSLERLICRRRLSQLSEHSQQSPQSAANHRETRPAVDDLAW